MFQRVDSRPGLTSRRSLITTLMHESDRAKALANSVTRSTPQIRRSGRRTPNGPSVVKSPEPNAQMPPSPKSHLEVPKGAKPIIIITSNTRQQQLAASPRTTRSNMISRELTRPLWRNLLREGKHWITSNLAASKQISTSDDIQNLEQDLEPSPLPHQDGFTNDYFHAGLMLRFDRSLPAIICLVMVEHRRH